MLLNGRSEQPHLMLSPHAVADAFWAKRQRDGLGPLKLVSLDVGNTLLTSDTPGLATMLTRAAKPSSSLDEAIGVLHTRLTTQSVVDQICEKLSIERIDLARYRPPEPLLLPGVTKSLGRLRKLNVRIVTLSNVASIDAVPIPEAISDHVDAQYQSFRIGAAKPDIAAFASMLKAEDVAPHDSIHIGDSWRCDALGAHSAGMSTIWVASPPAVREARPQAGTVVVSSFSEAVDVLVRDPNYE